MQMVQPVWLMPLTALKVPQFITQITSNFGMCGEVTILFKSWTFL